MHPTDVLDLITEHMAYGEADPAELPDDLDELLHLRTLLQEARAAALAVRQAVDEKVGALLGPGRTHEYGDSVVSWRHGYKWKPIPEAAERFVEDVAAEDPGLVKELFNLNSMRKTGVERAANRLGVDPETAVGTVLEKVWDQNPSVQVKPKEL